MRHDENACDLYQIVTGILAEPDNQKEMDAVVVTDGDACHGVCEDDRHEFEIATSEGQRYRVVLECKKVAGE